GTRGRTRGTSIANERLQEGPGSCAIEVPRVRPRLPLRGRPIVKSNVRIDTSLMASVRPNVATATPAEIADAQHRSRKLAFDVRDRRADRAHRRAGAKTSLFVHHLDAPTRIERHGIQERAAIRTPDAGRAELFRRRANERIELGGRQAVEGMTLRPDRDGLYGERTTRRQNE